MTSLRSAPWLVATEPLTFHVSAVQLPLTPFAWQTSTLVGVMLGFGGRQSRPLVGSLSKSAVPFGQVCWSGGITSVGAVQPFARIVAPVSPAGAPKIVDQDVPAPASVPSPAPSKLSTS